MKVEFEKRSGEYSNDISHWECDENKVKAYHYPYCCTGLVIANLGGSDTEYNGNPLSEEALTQAIQGWIEFFTVGDERVHRKQFISACTTDEQVVANTVLEALGFSQSPWVENLKYEGTKLCTWVLAIGHLNTYDGED